MPANSFQLFHRERKARLLVKVMVGLNTSDLGRCPADSPIWLQAAQQAGVKPPSAETCALVIQYLRENEQGAA
jgi:hypothetical protein